MILWPSILSLENFPKQERASISLNITWISRKKYLFSLSSQHCFDFVSIVMFRCHRVHQFYYSKLQHVKKWLFKTIHNLVEMFNIFSYLTIVYTFFFTIVYTSSHNYLEFELLRVKLTQQLYCLLIANCRCDNDILKRHIT
jgi:hypothetical protein